MILASSRSLHFSTSPFKPNVSSEEDRGRGITTCYLLLFSLDACSDSDLIDRRSSSFARAKNEKRRTRNRSQDKTAGGRRKPRRGNDFDFK